jgi:hypothetical protein
MIDFKHMAKGRSYGVALPLFTHGDTTEAEVVETGIGRRKLPLLQIESGAVARTTEKRAPLDHRLPG